MSSSDSQPQRQTTRQRGERQEDMTKRQPPPAPASARTRVRFFPRVMIYVTMSMDDITPSERADSWYSKSELAAEQDENVRQINQYTSNSRNDHEEEHEEEEWTLRGLEHLTGMEVFQARKRARDDVVRAVLGCQGEARRSGERTLWSKLWRSIADASIMTTKHCRNLATRAGFRDAAVALRLCNNNDNNGADIPAGLRKRRDVEREDATPRRRQHTLHRTPPSSIGQDLLDQVDAVLDETPEKSTTKSAPSVMESLPFLFPSLPGRRTLGALPEHKNGILSDLLAARVRAILAHPDPKMHEREKKNRAGVAHDDKKSSEQPFLSLRGLQNAAAAVKQIEGSRGNARASLRDAINNNRQ